MDELAICRGPSRCSAHPRGVEGPVVAPGTDGARPEMDAPEPAVTPAQHNLLGQSCCQSPRWEPGPGRGSSEPAQARACQPQRVPDPRSWAGRQDPGARTSPTIAQVHSRTKPTPRCVREDRHAHTPKRARPAPALLAGPALGRDPRRRVSAPGKPSAGPSRLSRPSSPPRGRQAGFPERVGRGGISWPQTRGGNGRPPAPVRAAVLQLCPRAGVRGEVGGLRRSKELAKRLALRLGEPTRRGQPRERSAEPPGRCPSDNAAAPGALLRSSRRPRAGRVSPPNAHRATHVLPRCPPLSPGAAAREPGRRCCPFATKLSPLAAPRRPCTRAFEAPTAARVSRRPRPSRAGPQPARPRPQSALPPPGSHTPRLPHPFPSWPAPPTLTLRRQRMGSGRPRLRGLGGPLT
ncbi:uncharacterized protein RBU33_011320 [Hipposideros larvatus]